MTTRFDKLKELIVHRATPEGERAAALERLLAIVKDGGGPVTRSVRIGRRRQRVVVGEWERLEPYVDGMTYGDVIAEIYRACRVCNVQPLTIDFGFHDSTEAVIAIDFSAKALPNGLDLQDALRVKWSRARVSTTTSQGESERTYLLYLGVNMAELAGQGAAVSA